MAGDVSIGPFVVGETVVTSVISFLFYHYITDLVSLSSVVYFTSVGRSFRKSK